MYSMYAYCQHLQNPLHLRSICTWFSSRRSGWEEPMVCSLNMYARTRWCCKNYGCRCTHQWALDISRQGIYPPVTGGKIEKPWRTKQTAPGIENLHNTHVSSNYWIRAFEQREDTRQIICGVTSRSSWQRKQKSVKTSLPFGNSWYKQEPQIRMIYRGYGRPNGSSD